MGQAPSRTQPLTEQQISQSNRKCAAFVSALRGCRKANPADPGVACKNLEIKVVSCFAEDHCKEESVEHRKCYTKLYSTGMYKGLGHCIPYEEAMRASLKKLGLYPV